MKTRLLAIATLVLMTIGLNAQKNNSETKEFKHGIGLAAGSTTGYGLSYQYFPNKFGVQVVFGGIKASEYVNVSTGLVFKMDMVESKKASLFLYQSNSLIYSSYEYGDYDYETGELLGSTTERSYIFNNGIGVGSDISLGKRLSLNVMGGIGSYDVFEIVTITGEISAFYRL